MARTTIVPCVVKERNVNGLTTVIVDCFEIKVADQKLAFFD